MSAAAGLFEKRPGWRGEEGPRPLFTIAPGVVSLSWPDVARAERTAERQQAADREAASALGRYWAEYVGDPADPEPSRVITEWSRKSRARMTRTLAELDFTPMLRIGLKLPMTTLTYPGDWLAVAPTGKAVKRHMDQFRKRFERAWGFAFLGIWKLEFQRRGAPHIHLWGPEPEGTAGALRRMTQARYRPAVGDGLEYRQWLSAVWTDVVFTEVEAQMAEAEEKTGRTDPRRDHIAEQRRRHLLAGTAVDFREGDRMRDPKRLAIYFTKHGSFSAKEYQHQVPVEWQEPGAGPGRFWGYWGLNKATAGVELEPVLAVWAGRILRRYARAQRVTRQVTVRRTAGGVPRAVDRVIGLAGTAYAEPTKTRYRKVRRPVVRLANGRGFLCVNDGPGLAGSLARALDLGRTPPPPAERAWGPPGRPRPGVTGLSNA
ncbi:rolling circle replication-associated protein [Streptomyces neyagawaensis]|uniref:rolling circle replication-associated protein n=1 Tax=Streptomyces neyagawaensis TaxID=42238 RepID=UPI0006E25645|nr:hypothetical protein [Streptomyces neyagawaensis]